MQPFFTHNYIARIWAYPDELVESARHHGMCADWLELTYPGGRACPEGTVGPAVSGIHAAHETTHPLCLVTEDQIPWPTTSDWRVLILSNVHQIRQIQRKNGIITILKRD